MCYLIAKDTQKRGCYALKTFHGEHLVKLKQMLGEIVDGRNIQLVTLSRPSAFGEYAPYSFADDEDEFIRAVKSMIE